MTLIANTRAKPQRIAYIRASVYDDYSSAARGCAGAAAESRRRHRMSSSKTSTTRTTTRQTEHARAHERNPFAFGVLRSTIFFEWSCASDGDDKKGDGHLQRQVMGGWMGVGRAGESERTCSPSCGSMSSVDLDHESPTRRRPVRVRRRRSQRRAERGERSEGGKCQRTIGSIVRGAPPREPIKRAPGPQTIEPISPQCLCPSPRTQIFRARVEHFRRNLTGIYRNLPHF